MSLRKIHLNALLTFFGGSLVMILFFQNCAQHGFGPNGEIVRDSLSGNITQETNEETNETQVEKQAQAAVESFVPRDARPPATDPMVYSQNRENFLAAKDILIDQSGHLMPGNWEKRIGQLTDLESTMTSETEAEVVAIAKEVLSQLLNEVKEADAPTLAQFKVLRRAIDIMSYGIKSPQDRFDLETQFVAQSRNERLTTRISGVIHGTE